MNFLKAFAKGLLWILLVPFILVAMIFAAAWGIINFFIQTGKLLFNFFTGKKLFPTFEEDKKAYSIMKHSLDVANGTAAMEAAKMAAASQPQPIYVQQNIYQTTPTNNLPNIELPNGQSIPSPQPQISQAPTPPIIDYSNPNSQPMPQIEQPYKPKEIELAKFNQADLDDGGDL